MSRSKKSKADTQEAPVESQPAEKPAKEPKTRLRLKNNDFVHGKFTKGGTVVEFSREEAKKHLSTTDKWEYADK